MYLKPNAVLEPLYQQWYAWPHLISPATAAMNVLHRHLRIMDSFVQAPAMHQRFARDPSMVGSPFMDLAADRAGELAGLRDRTRAEYGPIIAFAQGVAELGARLRHEAQGYSLAELYAHVPDVLRGYVELYYDLDNHAWFRFFEPLLYRSPYYDVSAQSVALYLFDRDERPFVLSTPRLPDDGVLHLPVPFAHAGLDTLFRMRTEPGSPASAGAQLGISAAQEPVFDELFTDKPPTRRAAYDGDGVRVTYFGHACILLECNGLSVLTDPSVSAGGGSEVPRYTYADLPDRIDFVLITHNHQDHVLFETLLQLRHKVGHVVVPRNAGGSLEDPSLKLMFRALGFRVLELEELESLELPGCTVTGLPFAGEHADLNIRSKLIYLVSFGEGKVFMFAADSCSVEQELYRHVREIVGRTDVLFMGMECDGAPLSWLYGPLLPQRLPRDMDHSRRLAGSNCELGMNLVRHFDPVEVYVYAMGQEPWLSHIMGLKYTSESNPIIASDALIAECRASGIVAERLFGGRVLTRGA